MAAKDRLYKGQPGTVDANLFTAVKDYEGLIIWAVNGTTATVPLTLTHVDTSNNSMPLVSMCIPAGGTADIRVPVHIYANESVKGHQGIAGALTIFIDGVLSL